MEGSQERLCSKKATGRSPTRIPVELHSRNRSSKPIASSSHEQKLHDGGWQHTRTDSLQPVHRYRVRFITDLENNIFFTPPENLIGSQRRFGSVIADKNKLSIQEGSRQRVRLRRRNMVVGRSGETRDCSFYLTEEIPSELAWKRKMCPIDSFSWRETRIVLWSSHESKHHQR